MNGITVNFFLFKNLHLYRTVEVSVGVSAITMKNVLVENNITGWRPNFKGLKQLSILVLFAIFKYFLKVNLGMMPFNFNAGMVDGKNKRWEKKETSLCFIASYKQNEIQCLF